MKRHNRFLRLVAGLAALTAGSVALAPSADAHSMSDLHDSRGPIVDLVRAALATAPFLSPDIASRAGYSAVVADVNNITCIAEPGQGAMGEHHLNPNLVDLTGSPVQDTVEVTKPELVVYRARRLGSPPPGRARIPHPQERVGRGALRSAEPVRPRLHGDRRRKPLRPPRLLLTARVAVEVQPQRAVLHVEPERALPELILSPWGLAGSA